MPDTSVIGADVTVTGTLFSSGDVTIDGQVRGDISTTGTVLVKPSGRVFGNIYAQQTIIHGTVEGGLNSNKLQLGASSHVKGDIVHARIAIEEGAFIDGNCRHAENPLAAAPKFEPKAKR